MSYQGPSAANSHPDQLPMSIPVLLAEERSEHEEPATTSADDEASKKNVTEQQKQLSKKVSNKC